MSIKILNEIQWTDPIASQPNAAIPNTQHWMRSDLVPQPKQTRLISLPYSNYLDTAIARSRYLFYKPALSSINGYEESYAAEIDAFHLVDANLTELACEIEDFNRNPRVWYLVEINNVFEFKDFWLYRNSRGRH